MRGVGRMAARDGRSVIWKEAQLTVSGRQGALLRRLPGEEGSTTWRGLLRSLPSAQLAAVRCDRARETRRQPRQGWQLCRTGSRDQSLADSESGDMAGAGTRQLGTVVRAVIRQCDPIRQWQKASGQRSACGGGSG